MTDKVYKKKSFLRDPVAFLSIFYVYIGPLAFAAYGLAIFRSKLKLPLIDWFILINIIISILVASFFINIFEIFQMYRFYWGFLIFYIFFRSIQNINFNFDKLLITLIILTIIESVLVNSIISAEILPNYPSKFTSSSHFSELYQRVFGFGGNPAVLSVLLVAILCLSSQSIGLVVGVLITTMVASSGSGFIAFLIYIVFHKFKHKGLILIILFIATMIAYQVNADIFYKVSWEYLTYLIENKVLQIEGVWSNLTKFQVLFGTQNLSDLGGDFVWLSFFNIYGLYGSSLFIFFILHKLNKKNLLGVFIILILTFHYFVLFSMPGQLIFGYLLALKHRTYDDKIYRNIEI